MSTIALIVAGLAALQGAEAQSQWCYNGYGRRYRCNRGGLGYGARIGIGVGIAAGVLLLFLLCGYWKRKQLQRRFRQHKPPALPFAHNGQQSGPDQGYNPYTNGNGGNDYSNNPPPPQSSFQQTNSYGPQTPAATYQPSMAGQYRNEDASGGDHEHGYEWQQAREQERLEREAAQGTGAAPPAYDPTNVGTGAGNKGYAPPSGPPPK